MEYLTQTINKVILEGMENTGLEFKPITEGLGFHPFSDGLPYAPVTKTQVKNTTRVGTAPQISHPPLVPTIPKFVTPPQAPVHKHIPQPLEISKTYGASYVFLRILSFTIDTVFNLVLSIMLLSIVLILENISPELLLGPTTILISLLFLAVFNWAVITAQEVVFQTSIGKKMFGLNIQGSAIRIFLRAVLFIPSFIFAGAGLVWALFDSQKRCWHDRAVNIQPTETLSL